MNLTPRQREVLDALDNFTEGTFLTEQYAGVLLPRLRELAVAGEAITSDAAFTWATEREWKPQDAGRLAGVAYAVRFWDRGQPGNAL